MRASSPRRALAWRFGVALLAASSPTMVPGCGGSGDDAPPATSAGQGGAGATGGNPGQGGSGGTASGAGGAGSGGGGAGAAGAGGSGGAGLAGGGSGGEGQAGSTQAGKGGQGGAGQAGAQGGLGGAGAAGGSAAGGSAAGGSAAGGSAAGGKAPFDWVGVVGTGQSLSIGGKAATPISTTQHFHNVKLLDSGPEPKYLLKAGGEFARGLVGLSLVPLVEPTRPSFPGYPNDYPNNIHGETPHTAMASTLSALWLARTGGDYVTVHSVVGVGGKTLEVIEKGGLGDSYAASLAEARAIKQLADDAGKSFGYGAVVLTHGESDAQTADYGAGVFKLWSSYNADLQAITGQEAAIPLLATQQSTRPSKEFNSAVRLWRSSVEHPGQVVCVGPKYHYEYSSDLLHMPPEGYRRMGVKYAQVFDHVVNKKLSWKPTQPIKASRNGAVITITFDVPVPPLVWDDNLPAPHQGANTFWKKGRGFEARDASGELAINGVEIVGDDTVEITLAKKPSGADLRVAYATTQDAPVSDMAGGTGKGLVGQLCDSDAFVGHDLETIEVDVTSGFSVVTGPAGAFAMRATYDIVEGPGAPPGLIVKHRDSDSQLTLSAPWPGPSGKAKLSFRYNMRNCAVHFSMAVP